MTNQELGYWLLWIVAIAGTVWSLGPPLVYAIFGHGFLRFRAVDDPSLAQPDQHDAEAQYWVGELTKLGFRPVGIVKESCWFSHVIHWVKHLELHMMVSADGKTWVSWYRHFDGDYFRVSLTTLTQNDGFVRTQFPGVGIVCNEEMAFKNDYRQGTPEGLLAEHQRYVGEFCDKHRVSPVAITLEAYAARDQQEDEKGMLTMNQTGNYIIPAFFFVIPAIVCYLVLHFYFPMQAHVMLAGSLSLGSITYLGFMKLIFPQMMHFGRDGEYTVQDV